MPHVQPLTHSFTRLMSIALVVLSTAGAFALFAPTGAIAQGAAGPTASESGYIEANGINYYYEIHGEGEPLLLLHGGLGSIEMFNPILPMLTENHQVIAVDLQGHGRTELGV